MTDRPINIEVANDDAPLASHSRHSNEIHPSLPPSLAQGEVEFAPCMSGQPYSTLPSAELEAGTDLIPARPGPRIKRISESLVVKYGVDVTLSEAETISLVARKAPTVPVPKIRNAYRMAGKTYIVMDYIDGVPLGSVWRNMSSVEKDSVVADLQRYVSAWRCIKGDSFGAVGGDACRERFFKHPYEGPEVPYGPFTSRKDYNEGIVRALWASRPMKVEHDVELEQKILSSSGEAMILTHGDLHMGNIFINNDRKIIAILDWDASCYSVEEMEYCAAQWSTRNIEWRNRVHEFAPGTPEKFQFWNHINEELRLYSGI